MALRGTELNLDVIKENGITFSCNDEPSQFTIKAILYFSQKISAAQNEVVPSHHRLRGLYFLEVIFEATIVLTVYYIL